MAWRVLGVGLFVGFWWVMALQTANEAILPTPADVVENVRLNFSGSPGLAYLGLEHTSYATNIAYTVLNALLAWVVGAAAGIAVGLVSARLQLVRSAFEPVLFIFGAVPVLVAAPFFLIWFGFSRWGQLALVAFYCFTVVAVVAQSAALGLAPEYEEYAASLGVPARRRFSSVVVPASVPAILGGLRVALGSAWSLQAIAELLGSEQGVGRVITIRAGLSDAAGMMAVIIALGLVALACDLVLRVLIRRVLRWQET